MSRLDESVGQKLPNRLLHSQDILIDPESVELAVDAIGAVLTAEHAYVESNDALVTSPFALARYVGQFVGIATFTLWKDSHELGLQIPDAFSEDVMLRDALIYARTVERRLHPRHITPMTDAQRSHLDWIDPAVNQAASARYVEAKLNHDVGLIIGKLIVPGHYTQDRALTSFGGLVMNCLQPSAEQQAEAA